MKPAELRPLPLPAGLRSRQVEGVNGLSMHVLEAGEPERPCLLLLHGFPELAWSWRKIMGPLAQLGYYVLAPDQRGYGRTTGWDARYDGDLASFRVANIVADTRALLRALGIGAVKAVIGHDFGSPVAAACAVMHPETFPAVSLMSAPFGGVPAKPPPATDPVHEALAALPRPRKHYQWYYSTPEADGNMRRCPQGLHAFLRAYYHMKSADWAQNRPFELAGWTAEELAKMPTYYIMDHGADMASTVAPEMPSPSEIAACRWLPEDELKVYTDEFARTGFQAALLWYRARTSGRFNADSAPYAGRGIAQPACFIAGASDWGPYQRPGELRRMAERGFADNRGIHFIEGAGHWVQQEQPAETVRLLESFLGRL